MMMDDIKLGLKLMAKERHATAVKILVVCFSLATFTMTLLNLVNQQGIDLIYNRAVDALGANVIIESNEPLPERIQAMAEDRDLDVVDLTLTFTVTSHNDIFQLSSIKAVGQGYPLVGQVQIKDKDDQTLMVDKPKPGHVFVERVLLKQLGLNVGDSIQIGVERWVIEAVLIKEPDALQGFFVLAPRVMMNLSDLEKTQVLQPGSRAKYQKWVKGTPSSAQAFTQAVKALNEPSIEIEDFESGDGAIANVVRYASSYLGLIIMLSVILSGLALSTAAHVWVEGRVQQFALLKVLGLGPNRLLRVMMYGLVFWGGLFAVVMMGLAAFCANGLFGYLAQTTDLPLSSMRLEPFMLSGFVSLCLLIGFVIPPLWGCRKLSPMANFKQHSYDHKGAWRWYAITIIGCCLGLFYYIDNTQLTLVLIAGLGWGAFISYVVLNLMIWLLAKLKVKALAPRLALSQLVHQQSSNVMQVIALTMCLAALLVLQGVKGEFLVDWKATLPEKTPNYFLINIPQAQSQDIANLVNPLVDEPLVFYPITRGRLTLVNGQAVEQNVDGGPPGVSRPLNLTWLDELPMHNKIVKGPAQWGDVSSDDPIMSVEKSFAKRMGVDVGDTMTFTILGQDITARIHNIREVVWQSFMPNFYVIYPKGIISQLPAVSMSSFYLEDNESIIATIRNQFPEVTIIDVDDLIQQVQGLIGQFVIGIEALLLIVLGFSFVVFYAILTASKPTRAHWSSLLRLLGSPAKQVRHIQWIELGLIALIATLVGIATSQWVLHELSKRVFNLTYDVDWMFLAQVTVAMILGLIFLGGWMLRKVPKRSPLALLKNQQ